MFHRSAWQRCVERAKEPSVLYERWTFGLPQLRSKLPVTSRVSNFHFSNVAHIRELCKQSARYWLIGIIITTSYTSCYGTSILGCIVSCCFFMRLWHITSRFRRRLLIFWLLEIGSSSIATFCSSPTCFSSEEASYRNLDIPWNEEDVEYPVLSEAPTEKKYLCEPYSCLCSGCAVNGSRKYSTPSLRSSY